MKDRKTLVVIGALVSFVSWTSTVHAQGDPIPRRDAALETSRGIAMGTGNRASAASTSAVAYNPAALPMGRLYHIEGFFGYDNDVERWTVGGTIIDSMTNKLAAGLSFRGFLGNGEDGYGGLDGRLALGFPLSEAVAIGLAGRYLSLTREGQTPEGESDTLARGFTGDVALLVQPVEGLRLAALGYNLIDVDSALAPVLLGGSASFSVGEMLSFGGDVLFDMTTFESGQLLTGGGVEYLAGGQIPLRLGYRYDRGRHLHSVTAGIGYVDQHIGLDVSLTQDVRGDDATEVLAAVRYFVH
jgi:hypothetical protein